MTTDHVKVLVGVPCFENVRYQCLQSLYEMDAVPGVGVSVKVFPGYGPALARNKIALAAVSGGFNYVLYVDSDQIVPPNLLSCLLACDAPMAAGWSLMAVNDNRTNISKFNQERNFYDFILLQDLPSQVIQVDAIGFAANLIKTSIFSELSYPYFKYLEYPNGSVLSEDLYFCDQLRKRGLVVKCDPSLRVSHIKTLII